MTIGENLYKSMKIHENLCQSMKISINECESMHLPLVVCLSGPALVQVSSLRVVGAVGLLRMAPCRLLQGNESHHPLSIAQFKSIHQRAGSPHLPLAACWSGPALVQVSSLCVVGAVGLL